MMMQSPYLIGRLLECQVTFRSPDGDASNNLLIVHLVDFVRPFFASGARPELPEYRQRGSKLGLNAGSR